MTYAPNNRNFYDADSHVMELPNFIIDYADKEFKDLINRNNFLKDKAKCPGAWFFLEQYGKGKRIKIKQ